MVTMKPVQSGIKPGYPDKIRDRLKFLEELNQDLMGMIENSYDAMCIADGEGKILLLNPAFERVMGFKNMELMGRKIPEIVQEGLTDTAATIRVIETGKEETVLINTITGKQVLSTGRPVYKNGKIQRIYCNLRDVTDLNHLREQFELSKKLVSKYLIELNELKKLQTSQKELVTRNIEMKQLVDFAYHMAQVDSPVLILGESGVGKDMIARILHEASPRSITGEFVKINCGAIPEPLLESELFGYEPGAFTGARKEGKIGYFEVANKGTLFLDEIGDLSKALQVKLLGVLQDQKVYRIGGTSPKEVDVRIIAATNRDLEKMIKEGLFREDLYYRLSVVPITIPALRSRKDDIPFLLVHFIKKFNQKYGKELHISNDVMDILSSYSWPGNVRELSNLVERLVLTTNESTVLPEHLPGKYLTGEENFRQIDFKVKNKLLSLKEEVERFELRLVKQVLSDCAKQEEAACKLGISLASLTRRIKKLKQVKNDDHL
jgi:PAS domain S-box-containing protein